MRFLRCFPVKIGKAIVQSAYEGGQDQRTLLSRCALGLGS